MENANILMLRSNPVNPDSRVEKEATALSDFGYKVTVLCWDRESNHPPILTKLTDSRVNVIRVGYKASYGEGMKNIIPFLKFQMKMKKWIKKNINNYDAIHACDFDTAFFSYKTVLRRKKIFVFDIFDFICGEPKTLFQKIIKKKQIRIINEADATIICSEDRKKQILNSHPKRLEVIHNSPPLTFFDDTKSKSESVDIVYVGILSDNRLLKEESEVFINHPEWNFHVGGFGLYDEYFRNISRKYPNIKFYGKLSYPDTLELESKADIMLAVYDPSIENHRYAAPNKFYEALMLGKPLIMVKNTGMTFELENNNLGMLIDYSYDGFEKGIEELVINKEKWNNISSLMKDLYKEKYSWDIMKERLKKLYYCLFNQGEKE